MVLTEYAELELNRQASLKNYELAVNLAVKGNQSLNSASVLFWLQASQSTECKLQVKPIIDPNLTTQSL